METSVTLTPLGKKAADNIVGRGEVNLLLSALAEHGTTGLGEVAKLTGLDKHRVRVLARELVAAGYIKPIRGTE